MQNTNPVRNSMTKINMSLLVLFLTLCSMAVVHCSCPTSIPEGSAVNLNIQCYRGEAQVTWRSNGEADVVNLEYNCNPTNGANFQTNQKSNLLDWSQLTSGERNITASVLAGNAYKCTVSGCYEDNWLLDRFQIPEQSCTFTPEPPTPSTATVTPSSSSTLSTSSSPSPSPSLTASLSPSLSLSPSPSLTSPSSSASIEVLSQLQSPTPTPDTICCSCGAAAQLIQAKSTNASFSKPGIFQVFTDNGTIFTCILAALVLVILLQFIAICVLCLQLKSLKKTTKGPIAI